jgi:magnesium and cobalt transporter
VALPEAQDLLGADNLDDESDTIGGYVVAQLGRLPRSGDELTIGRYRVRIKEVRQRRIVRLHCEPVEARVSTSAHSADPGDERED